MEAQPLFHTVGDATADTILEKMSVVATEQ
jgi:hypothetical protein